MPDSFITNPCNFFFISLDKNQHPIPGTMRSKPNNQIDPGYTQCNEARLTPYQMVAPLNKKQCFNSSGFRWFYQFNNITKQILPNSLIQRIGKPKEMCVGTNTYLEYKIFG